MCEVLVCLNSRGLLPDALSREDVAIVSDHVAWRWFENLGEPILAKSAMFKFARRLVVDMKRKANEGSVDIGVDDRPRGGEDDVAERRKGREEEEEEEKAVEEEPMLRIYSAHDSTLIGLLCVLGLEKPIEWPEYGSALKVELILEEEELANDAISPRRHWVRFSLNGQLLRCTWHRNERDEPASMVPLHELEEMIHMEHELFDDECDDSRLKYSWKGGKLCEH
jgi:acid phosphatase